VGALFIIGFNIFITSFLLVLIKYAFRVPLRMSDEALLIGDDAIHGEDAYTFEELPRSILYGDTERVPVRGDGELGTPIPGKSSNDEVKSD
jgi:hypothetical protein